MLHKFASLIPLLLTLYLPLIKDTYISSPKQNDIQYYQQYDFHSDISSHHDSIGYKYVRLKGEGFNLMFRK
jgi:hypothetical protein